MNFDDIAPVRQTSAGLKLQPERPPRLLVVDDQPANVRALYEAFAADHQVFMATTGEQAMEVCAAQLPDLVLLDVELPDIDGHEVCRRLKALESTRDIPVIFVTAHDGESDETRGLDAGAVDYISKPVNPRIVRARVRTHLTLKRQSDLLRQWVYIDGLTGLCNRRYFDEQLAAEWGRAVRQGSSLGVLLIDVDFFKAYNDRYGHQAGDDALRQVATVLRTGLKRPGDLLARYGGEEFVCLLPDTDLPGVLALARHLGRLVQEQGIEHAGSSVADVLTVSLGACTKADDAVGNASLLLREADAQLYTAKTRGRNQSCGCEFGAE